MAETVDFVKGRESVWIELLQRAEQEVYKRDVAIQELADKLKPQEDNEKLIDNQAARIKHLEEANQIANGSCDARDKTIRDVQARYSLLLEMCMTTNNLSAEQRLYAIRNEHKVEWEAYKKSTREKHEED